MPIDLTPIDHLLVEHRAVGSRVTCDPAPTDTDEDHLVWVWPDDLDATLEALEAAGYREAEAYATYAGNARTDWGANFLSLRNGEINILLTTSETFFRRFVAASSVAERLNLLDKEDRICLFQAVLYANPCSVF